ncbi:MAG TPA: spermidine/putrescine ABC transporter substrate-binding protein [Micromonosporaceae bacterium]|nr:spermidine/putrescine ABC transporter substrate-binding protein [Micromonosporaceae bacterium]
MRTTPDYWPRGVTPRASAFSRRTLLRGVLAGGLATTGLTACGTEGTRKTAEECQSEDRSAAEKQLAFSNWPLYIDVDEKDESKRPTLEAFIQQTGIQVKYTEDINDNNEFFGKVRNQLARCQSTGRDVFVLTDWMAARLIRLGWVQSLDTGNLPNVQANLLDSLRDVSWDRERERSVPWQSGLTGLAYNAKVTKEIRTFDELLTRADLKGKVTLLSEMRDTMTLSLLSLGKDPENFTEDDFDAAIDKVAKATDSGQVRRFTGNDYAQDLAKGDIAACVAWSGDVLQLQLEDPNIKFVVPEEGALLFSDNVQVPNKATHKANAEKLMDYYYQPEVAAELAAYVNYICPVKGAQEAMTRIDPDLAENVLIFPDAATLRRTHAFKALTEKEERTYEAKFQKVVGA